jgi:hypothetical protein
MILPSSMHFVFCVLNVRILMKPLSKITHVNRSFRLDNEGVEDLLSVCV